MQKPWAAAAGRAETEEEWEVEEAKEETSQG